MNIILIGMRGAGKSTVAHLLAKKLSIPLVETDILIEERVQVPISDFVKQNGWEQFRLIESDVVKKIAAAENTIISTCGGVILKKENVDLLKRNGRVFYLKTTVDSLNKRVGNNQNRPALTDKPILREEMAEVLHQRARLYEDAADEIVETDNFSKDQVAEKILTLLSDIYVY